ncbi:MerR family transcriptional regulator [Labilibaculum antarcticum]|nr:MerR family transcriptional regulator [Labilibaculum antarcticum]
MGEYITLSNTSKLIGTSKETLRRWDREGKLIAVKEPISNCRVYRKRDMQEFMGELFVTEEESNEAKPSKDFTVFGLFAVGGLVIGMELAGFKCIVLNEICIVSLGYYGILERYPLTNVQLSDTFLISTGLKRINNPVQFLFCFTDMLVCRNWFSSI